MLADYYTKALQGELFTIFRNVIMGYEHISTLSIFECSEFEERVGINNKNTNAKK